MLLPEDDPDGVAFVIRTDFADLRRWRAVRNAIRRPMRDIDTEVQFIEDREYEGASPQDLLPVLHQGNFAHDFVFIVDRTSLESPEYPVVVLDLYDEPGRMFRAIPSQLPNIFANLWLANMDFQDYSNSVGADGVFRGFRKK
jgi:hypothetical protein